MYSCLSMDTKTASHLCAAGAGAADPNVGVALDIALSDLQQKQENQQTGHNEGVGQRRQARTWGMA